MWTADTPLAWVTNVNSMRSSFLGGSLESPNFEPDSKENVLKQPGALHCHCLRDGYQ